MNTYFFTAYPARPLAGFRIFLGLLLAVFYFQIRPDFFTLFGSELRDWKPEWLPAEPWAYALLNSVCVILALAVAAGLFTRTSLALMALAQAFLHSLNNDATWSWAPMSVHFLLFLLLADPGRTWSLDVRLKLREEKMDSPAWNYHLILWQVSLIYAVAVLWRIESAGWWRGEALAATLSDSVFSRVSYLDLSAFAPWMTVFSKLGFGLEILGATLALWTHRWRRWLALGLIFFHVFVALTTTVQIWQQVMIGALAVGVAGPRADRKNFEGRSFWPWILSVYIIWAGLTAVPSILLPEPADRLRRAALVPLKRVRLSATSNMKLFHAVPRFGRRCFYAFGRRKDGSTALIYDRSDYCFGNRYRVTEDEVFSSVYRMANRREGARSRLGRYFCRLGGLELATVALVHRFERREAAWGPDLTPHAQVPVTFDCEKDRLSPPSTDLLSSIVRDYPEYVGPF